MRIKIVSDGSAYGTHLIDADTGENLDSALRCTHLECDAQDGLMVATLTIRDVAIDVTVPEVLMERVATLEYDPDDTDSIDQAIAELQQQRAARVAS